MHEYASPADSKRQKGESQSQMGTQSQSPTGSDTVVAPVSIIGTDAVVSHLDPDTYVVKEADNHSRSLIGRYEDDEFAELMGSIRQTGVIQPVLFVMDADTGRPTLKVGFRRMEAVKRLRSLYPEESRFWSIPGIEINPDALTPGILSELDANFAENQFRKNPSAIDNAHAITEYESAGLKGTEIAARMRKSTTWVSKKRKLLSLPEALQLKIHKGEYDSEVAYELTKKSKAVQQAAAEGIESGEEAGTGVTDPGSQSDSATTSNKMGKGKKARKVKLTRRNVKSAKVAKGKKGKGTAKSLSVSKPSKATIAAAKDAQVLLTLGLLLKSVAANKKATPTAKSIATAIIAYAKGKVKGAAVLKAVLAAHPKSVPTRNLAPSAKKAKSKSKSKSKPVMKAKAKKSKSKSRPKTKAKSTPKPDAAPAAAAEAAPEKGGTE